MTPQLRPEMRPKTRLAGHSAAGPRSEKRLISSRSRLTSACHVVGRVARNSGGLCPFPFGQGTTWIANQLNGAWASGPVGGPVSSSPSPWRRSQLTWHTISGAVKRPHRGLRSGAKRPMRSSTSWRRWASKSDGIPHLCRNLGAACRTIRTVACSLWGDVGDLPTLGVRPEHGSQDRPTHGADDRDPEDFPLVDCITNPERGEAVGTEFRQRRHDEPKSTDSCRPANGEQAGLGLAHFDRTDVEERQRISDGTGGA